MELGDSDKLTGQRTRGPQLPQPALGLWDNSPGPGSYICTSWTLLALRLNVSVVILRCVDMCVCVGFPWPVARQVHAEDHMTCTVCTTCNSHDPLPRGQRAHTCMTQTGDEQFLAGKVHHSSFMQQTSWCPREVGEDSYAVHVEPRVTEDKISIFTRKDVIHNCKDQGCCVLCGAGERLQHWDVQGKSAG